MTTKVTITYEDSEDDNLGTRVVTLSREKDELYAQDMLYFFSEAMRACGYDYVNRVGYCTDKGAETWSQF